MGRLVFLITFLVYSPLLSHQIVGDDWVFFGGNTFYSSWKNIPRIFEKGYISDPQKINYINDFPADLGSGSFSYRPVTSLTLFGDYHYFLNKPFGSHLINILIHCVNAVLVFWIVTQVFSSSILGVFTGLLFSLHPIQSEAVNNINCRFDLFAAMFTLLCIYFWIKFRQGTGKTGKFYFFSLMMCFLALFSKEAAVTLPFVILLYDQTLAFPYIGLRKRWAHYIAFIVILIFYLYIYMVVFSPNAVSLDVHWLKTAFIKRCLFIGYIWFNYLINIFFPWTVKMIPGLYSPPIPAGDSLLTVEIITAFIALIMCLWAFWRHYRKVFFFLAGYILFYFPVSNVLLLANPMACRFMYLPSISLLIVLAYFLHNAFQSDPLKKISAYLPAMLYGVVILICVIRTEFLNNDWKDDVHVQRAWVRDYPAYGRGYALLGMGYYNEGHLEKARAYLEKGIVLGDQMPKDEYALALCYMHLKKYDLAQTLLKKIMLQYPDYDDPYFCSGAAYYEQKNYGQAQGILEKGLALSPRKLFGYVMLMKVYSHLHNLEAEKHLFIKADKNLTAENALELRKILQETKDTI